MRILALDLATKTGWASGYTAHSGVVVSGNIDLLSEAAGKFSLPNARVEACHKYAILDAFVEFLCRHTDGHPTNIVAIEEQTYRGKGSRLLQGFRAIAEAQAAHHGARVIVIGASRARELALGNGGYSKEEAHAVARALQLPGFSEATTEDARDAVILLEAVKVHLSQMARNRALPKTKPVKKRRAA